MSKDHLPPASESGQAASLVKKTQDLIVPEILEAIRQEGGHVDVNLLLVQIVNKTEDPDAIVENSKKLLAVAQRYEEQRVENFKRMADAIIDVKGRDPDEVEKRRNNRMRRCLKGIVGGCAVFGLGGGILASTMGGSIVATGALLAAGSIALALSGPLATGESVSPNDVVRIVTALRTMLPGGRPSDDEKPSGSRSKGRSRR